LDAFQEEVTLSSFALSPYIIVATKGYVPEIRGGYRRGKERWPIGGAEDNEAEILHLLETIPQQECNAKRK
jgi:hypothetical protein